MKKLILLLFIFGLFFGCQIDKNEEKPNNPPVIEPPVTEPPIVEPEDDYVVELALYDGQTLRYWDGTTMHDAYIGHIEHAGHRRISIDNVLYWMNENGQSVQSQWLPVVPDAITTREAGAKASVVYEDDVFTLEDIPPEEAYALGALYRHYTRVFVNSVEEGLWYMNQWEVVDVITTDSGHIIAIDAQKHWHNLTDSKEVYLAYDGGLMFYNMSSQHGYVADASGEYEITWVTNFMDNNHWQLADGVWYSDRGFTWTAEGGVVSNANELYCFNTYDTYPDWYDAPFAQSPFTVPGGVRTEHGEEVTFWIECVTGTLYKHIPSTDQIVVVVEIYEGPMSREGGWAKAQVLEPEIVGNHFYYHEGGSIRRMDFDSGVLSIFSTEQELIPWE